MDLLVAWDWEYDIDFIGRLEEKAGVFGLKCFFVNPQNLKESFSKILTNKIMFKVFLDRASDTSEEFDSLIDEVILSGAHTLNEASNAVRAMDKATMHLEFLGRGIDVPYSIILAPSDSEYKIKKNELKRLGRPFIIKPSRGGGGCGVVTGAETLNDVITARQEYADDKYLLQEKVIPKILGKHKAWFRIFYVCGKVIPSWWDDQTHIYTIIDKEEEKKYKLGKLKEICKTIAEISRLDFFSTEICITETGRHVVVDYVNDPVDMRPRSVHVDGVPDEIVTEIIDEIVLFVKNVRRSKVTPAKKDLLIRRRDFELALLHRHR